MFIDSATAKVTGGNGGNGCMSFRREKYVPMGGPDGGDGGKGGDVIFRAVNGKQSLIELRYMPHFEGKRGAHGKGKKLHGQRGADRLVEIPVGTSVFDTETGELLADLVAEGQEFIAARGGRGGRGNAKFMSSVNQAPRRADSGSPGEEKLLRLEFKIIADVGLVGYPNAGKSTLISAVSDAHPKIASYPFTTLNPAIGVVEFPDYYRITVADLPGLIAGAHDNIGLGHKFLRHIERAKVLIIVLDTAAEDNREPLADYQALINELKLYQDGLEQKVVMVIANKMDLPQAQENLPELQKNMQLPVFPISAANLEHTEELMLRLREILEEKFPALPEA